MRFERQLDCITEEITTQEGAMRVLAGVLLMVSLAGCVAGPAPKPDEPTAQTQLPADKTIRDAFIACGAGMRSGVTGDIVANYDKLNTSGKITADVWRAVETAFLKYVPAADVQKALDRYDSCIERLAGKYVVDPPPAKPAAK
jgi:hypothetical protein